MSITFRFIFEGSVSDDLVETHEDGSSEKSVTLPGGTTEYHDEIKVENRKPVAVRIISIQGSASGVLSRAVLDAPVEIAAGANASAGISFEFQAENAGLAADCVVDVVAEAA